MRKFFKIIANLLIITIFATVLPMQAMAVEDETYNQGEEITSLSQDAPEAKIIGEVIEKREKNVKHFLKEDMSFEAAVYPNAVHYKDKDGKWVDIDNTLIEVIDTENNPVLENKNNSFKVEFAKKADAKKLVTVRNSGFTLSWGIETSRDFSASEAVWTNGMTLSR